MSGARKPAPVEPLEPVTPWRQRPGFMRALESARRKLGGRSIKPSEQVPGALVEVPLKDGMRHTGVLLWAAGRTCDVWFDDGLARRARTDIVAPRSGPAPEALVRVEAEVRMFASMHEGDRVRWERATGLVEGRIVEKCRYGAIVVTRGGKVIAVGFRKLWPVGVEARA